eukprot:jgi/Galph1/2413/GphlegSOOS_G1064.1
MSIGLSSMVDLSSQKENCAKKDEIDDRFDFLSPHTTSWEVPRMDTKMSPLLFSFSLDSGNLSSSTNADMRNCDKPLSQAKQTWTERVSVTEEAGSSEADTNMFSMTSLSAPSSLQIHSQSLFAFRVSSNYSGVFSSNADDFKYPSTDTTNTEKHELKERQPNILPQEQIALSFSGLRRQDSDASVDDLIFHEWRKMRPRSSLLRDDSMASLASLPRTESELSIEGERTNLEDHFSTSLKIESGEGSSCDLNLGKVDVNATQETKDVNERLFPSSTLNSITEYDSLANSVDTRKYFSQGEASNLPYLQAFNEQNTFPPSYRYHEFVPNFLNNTNITPQPGLRDRVSFSDPSGSTLYNNGHQRVIMNGFRDASFSKSFLEETRNQNCQSTSFAASKNLGPPSRFENVFYKDGLKPSAAAAAAIASAAAAAGNLKPNINPYNLGNIDNILYEKGGGAESSPVISSECYATSMPYSFMMSGATSSSNPAGSPLSVISGYRSSCSTNNSQGNGTSAKTWSMEEIVGRILELAKDQHGCRFLQVKLEEENPAYTAMILAECLDHLADLMVDPFGNYLCQKLFECCNEQQRLSILHHTSAVLAQVSMNMHGTRVVQRVMECVEVEEQMEIVCSALAPFTPQLMKDVNGNHVIQRCLQKVGPPQNQFIFDTVVTHCIELATHRHGCCVIQRCLDYATSAQKEQVCMEICENAFPLVQDAFGNYVVQYVLDLKNRLYIAKIVSQLAGHLYELSVQKFSSNVVEKCLQQVDSETRKHLIYELMADREIIGRLIHDAYGNYVVQRALQLAQAPQLEQFCDVIRPHLSSLKSTPYGKRIYSKIIKRFPQSLN